MKIAYLDLSPGIFEDYSLNPKRYGGGRIFASTLKQKSYFTIFADKACFENYTHLDRPNSYCSFDSSQRARAINGEPLINILPQLVEYDIIIHSHTSLYLNTDGLKAKQVVWSVGYLEQIHEKHEHLLLYNDYQAPQIKNPNIKIYKFILGKKLPDFSIRPKQNYIFQCSRHNDIFSSAVIASLCNKHKIKAYFAGPVDSNYNLLSQIDNINTFYLGQISEDTKIHFTSSARLYTMIHVGWPTPMNLSAIESLSYGTPLIVNPIGFWPTLIQDGFNGFYARDFENSLLKAWEDSSKISQEACYASVSKYNHNAMHETILDNLERIMLS